MPSVYIINFILPVSGGSVSGNSYSRETGVYV
nr:MAG TPA: hypothetical protein [Caudoviricetes sp.]